MFGGMLPSLMRWNQHRLKILFWGWGWVAVSGTAAEEEGLEGEKGDGKEGHGGRGQGGGGANGQGGAARHREFAVWGVG